MTPRVNLALAAASGLLLVLIQPLASLTFLAPFALLPILIVSASEASGRNRFLLGWLAGVIQWGGTCYWIRETLALHGGMPGWLAALLFVLFALAKGLHLAVFSYLTGWLFGLRWAAPVVALLWVGLERTHAELGFTWLLLGNAGANMGVPMRMAPIAGVYGVSFVFALMSASVAAWYLRRERTQLAWCAPLLALYLLPALPDVQAGRLNALAVQPNIPEDEPLSPADLRGLYDRLARRTLEAALNPSQPQPSLILWPEVPASLYYETDPAFKEQVSSVARLVEAPFIFGTVRFDTEGNPFNTAQFLTATGDAAGSYDKMNLVPFGEYVPPIFNLMVDKVSKEAGTFQPGREIRLFPSPGGKLGVFICYEAAFADHVRKIAKLGADVLVNLSNDGYFGRSAARQQHLMLARMRAAENARWFLRPTNDGFTVAIDPAGRVIDELPPYAFASGRLQYDTAFVITPYTRHGDVFAWAALAIGLAAGAISKFLK